jgi:hypothetical protein
MAGLEIQIGADSSDLQKKIKEAEFNLKELSKVKIEQIKLGLDTKEINGNIASVKKSLNDLKTASKDSGNAIAGMTPQVANGSNALMQFSRIAQDAPYGIIGIGNNITSTAEAFGYLKNQTGSTGSALKAMASSIMGSGGILLAVSLVTTAFTYMAQNGLSVGDVIDKMTGNFDSARKAMQDMNAEVAKNSQAQISSMNAYVSVAENVNLSMNDRLIAVKKLQQEYPAYFGNLSNEEILNGNVAGAVRAVTRAIIEKAKAAASVDKIVELAEEEEKIQSNIKNELAEVARGYQLNKKEAFAFAKAVLEGADAFKLLDPYKKRAGFFDVANAVALNNTLSKLDNQLISNRTKQDKLTDSINESTAAYIKLEDKAVKTTGTTKKAQEKYKNPNPNFDSGNGFIGGGIVNPNLGLITPDLGVDEAAIEANEKLRLALELQKKTIEDFNKELGSVVTNGTVNALAGIGESIGSALASGGNVIDAVGKSILGSMGSMLQELGKATIAYGVGLTAIQLAKKNPATAIAAGVAMVALGSMISKSVAKSSSVVGGGGSVSTGASVSSPTSSTGSGGSSSFTGGTVVFEISGQSLIGVLSNTLDKNRRLGGSLSLG